MEAAILELFKGRKKSPTQPYHALVVSPNMAKLFGLRQQNSAWDFRIPPYCMMGLNVKIFTSILVKSLSLA